MSLSSRWLSNEDFSGAGLVVEHLGEPDLPCKALAGDLFGHDWVDIALLRKLHAKLLTTTPIH